ncbi:hypothetical protein IWQ57_000836 [Coemansia nantahalensis]|uniref:Uncharacterized protein n=1 Tax=Coemansia nantahalensis TaxID=2789366 RepID=A0ACC1K6R8_9FUNG|nr:hypothetical protein IWQ57_000836 [Coemansia nantahalensis]
MTWPASSGSCGSNWLPAFPYLPRSACHSRSSSADTIVADMTVALMSPPTPPAASSPTPAASPMLIPYTALKMPQTTAPCSPRCHVGKDGRSLTPAHSLRRDSAVSCTPPPPAAAAPPPAVEADVAAHSGVFDMESDWPSTRPAAAELDPASLGYASKGKPQPWAVRPMDLYDSLRAQIRAIDDDDNEFYPA